MHASLHRHMVSDINTGSFFHEGNGLKYDGYTDITENHVVSWASWDCIILCLAYRDTAGSFIWVLKVVACIIFDDTITGGKRRNMTE